MYNYGNRRYLRGLLYGKGTFLQNPPAKLEDFDLQDISVAGMRIITDLKLNPGDKVPVELRLSKYLSEFCFHLEGEIVYSNEKDNRYVYGVKFINIGSHDQVHIDELIKHTLIAYPKDI